MLGMNRFLTATSIAAARGRRLPSAEGSRHMDSGAFRAGIEVRVLELAGRLMEVEAPAHWTNARLEAWLDWAGGRPDLASAVLEYSYALTAKAQARGLLKDLKSRTRFRMELTDAMLQGA